MKKINKSLLLLVAVALVGQSCKKDLVDSNTNPYLLEDVGPEYLFTGTTLNINLTDRARTMKKYGTSMTYMQYIARDVNTPDGLSSAYWNPTRTTGPNPGLYYYDDYFQGVGRDMNRIIKKIDGLPSEKQVSYQGLKAMASIVEVYHAWRVADAFGALPYSQAFQEDAYPLPTYDFDYTLYKVFDQKLKDAANLLKNNTTGQVDMKAQDFFYGGDYSKWQAFATTLRIKIAQRYQKRDAANLTSVLNDIATNFAGKIISGTAESFGYNHSRDWNDNVDDINDILLNQNASYAFVEFLKSMNDPRIKFMVRENDLGNNYAGYTTALDKGTPETKTALALPENKVRYYGKHAFPASVEGGFGATAGVRSVPFTLVDNKIQNLGVLSAIQTRLFVRNGGFGGFDARSSRDFMHSDEVYKERGEVIKRRTLYLSYAETCFMMAEIAQTNAGNSLGKTASQWFYAGIQASFDEYKTLAINNLVPAAADVQIGNFISTIPYLGLPSIYSQAWVNFLVQPEEAWAMWKRTGYPQFENVRPGVPNRIGDGSSIAYLEALWNGSANLIIPRRSALQLSTGSNPNSDNYYKAIQSMITKDAAYGKDAIDTKGRIWWDMQ